MSSNSNPHLIVKSNKLINAHLNGLTLSQLRFFEVLVAQLDRAQNDFYKQRVYLNDFVKETGTNNKNEYQRAREITKSMMKHVIEIFDEKEGLKQRNIFHSVDFPKGKPYVEVVFHPHLRPYLLQLKEKFTAYDIRNTLPLNSVYAVQLYQLLKQYLRIGTREFQLSELKKILGVDKKYSLYGDFKKRVLLASQKELQKNCDLTFNFKEIKKGKRVDRIVFIIIPQEKIGNEATTPVDVNENSIENNLLNLGLTQRQIKDLLSKHSEQYINELLEYTINRAKKGNIENVCAYFLSLANENISVAAKPNPKLVISEEQVKSKPMGKKAAPQDNFNELISYFQMEFENIWSKELERFSEEATTDDLKRFESYVKSIPYLSGKLMKKGRLNLDHKEFKQWLGNFLAPEFEQEFIKWVSENKGYQLQKDAEGSFKVIGKQEKLF